MQEIEHIKTFSPCEIVLRLVFSDYLPDHQTVCLAAETNKSFHALMLGMAKQKTYAMIRCPDYKNYFANFVHKYGTATYFVYADPSDFSLLKLWYCEFGHKNSKSQRFNGFLSALPCKQKAIFDESGNFYFYGYGGCNCTQFCGVSSGIIRYSIDGTKYFCIIYDDNRMPLNLSYILSYPLLLEAIINTSAKEVLVNEKNTCSSKYLEYDLNEIMLPHNYKERREFNWTKDDDGLPENYGPRKLFKDFPDDIKNAIEKRYEECCKIQR